MNYRQRITVDYRIMLGKPIIKGIDQEVIVRTEEKGQTFFNI